MNAFYHAINGVPILSHGEMPCHAKRRHWPSAAAPRAATACCSACLPHTLPAWPGLLCLLRCLPSGERLAARLPLLRLLGDGEPPDELVSELLLLVPEELVSDPLLLLQGSIIKSESSSS